MLALMDALDQKLAGADLVPNVFLGLGRLFRVGHQFLVRVADAEMRDLVVVQDDHVIAVDTADHDIGRDVLVLFTAEHPPGFGFQGGDEIGKFLDFLGRDTERTGDLRIATAAEILDVLADQGGFDAVRFPDPVQLDEQAFLQTAGADPDRVERLDEVESLLELLERDTATDGQFLDRGEQVPVIVDRPDDQLGDLALALVKVQETELVEKMLLERFFLGQ